MLFFEDLLKKLEEDSSKNIELRNIEKFGLNTRKRIFGYSIAIPLILIGLFQIYSYTVYHKWYILIFGMIFFALGLKQFKTTTTYSITIDTNSTRIKSGKLDMLLSNVETAVLKEIKLGKRVVPVIDIISTERRQIIVPLYMNKSIRFISVLRKMLDEKFSIVK